MHQSRGVGVGKDVVRKRSTRSDLSFFHRHPPIFPIPPHLYSLLPDMLSLSHTLLVAVLALSAFTSAAPSTPSLGDILRRGGDKDHSLDPYPTNCDLGDSKGVPTIPPNITVVDDEKPKYVFLARGTQSESPVHRGLAHVAARTCRSDAEISDSSVFFRFISAESDLADYTCETNPATNTFQWTSIGAVADLSVPPPVLSPRLPLHFPSSGSSLLHLSPVFPLRSYDASCLTSLPGSSYFPIAALAFIPYPADPSKFNWPIAAKHFFRVRGRPVFKLTSGDEPEFVGIRTGGADSPDDP